MDVGRSGILPRFLAILWLASLGIGLAGAPGRVASEAEIKAAFLFNFAKFVKWPTRTFADDQSPYIFGFFEGDPLADTLESLVQREQIKGRRIEIRRYAAQERLEGCHLLFVGRAQGARLEKVVRVAGEQSMLTVGDAEELTAQGVMISFARVEKTVRFDINKKAANQAGLSISSKLLGIARSVHG